MSLIAQQKQPNYIYLPIHQIKHTGQLYTLLAPLDKNARTIPKFEFISR